MKIQEVRDALYRELTPHLPGWKLVRKDEGFVRRFSGGLQKVVVPVYDYRPEFRFSLVFCTRLDAVEARFHEASGAEGPGQAASLTTMTQLLYFFPGDPKPQPKQFSVTTEADIAHAVAGLGPLLRDRALPLLDGMQTLAAVDAALNGDDPELDTSYLTQRTMHALATAWLARNPKFDELVARYEAQMSGFVDVLKQQVSRLVASLKKNPP